MNFSGSAFAIAVIVQVLKKQFPKVRVHPTTRLMFSFMKRWPFCYLVSSLVGRMTKKPTVPFIKSPLLLPCC